MTTRELGDVDAQQADPLMDLALSATSVGMRQLAVLFLLSVRAAARESTTRN